MFNLFIFFWKGVYTQTYELLFSGALAGYVCLKGLYKNDDESFVIRTLLTTCSCVTITERSGGN